MSLSVGDRLGRYEVLGPIGAGGMGEVWQARDNELGRDVAIKVLPEEMAVDPRRIERFRREARALAALSHPHLLEVYDVGATNGLDYVVTELLEGDTLRELVPPSGLPWKKVCELGSAVADGLAAAHDKGIVHRDLKPENVFVTTDGRVKILDFGLARFDEELIAGEETVSVTPTLTEEGTVLGTMGYMAPEQLRGRPADARSDVFSFGCVLYEMASGRRAFNGDTAAEVMAAILKEAPNELASSGAQTPEELARTIHRCLEKRPEARFQSASDLAYSLRSIGSGPEAPVMATTDSGGIGRKRPWLGAGVAALLVMIAAVIGWQALGGRDHEQLSPEATLGPNRIAIVPFTNRTGDPSLDNLVALTTNRITQGLVGLDEIEMAPASVVSAASAGVDPATLVREVAKSTGSGLVLTGEWNAVGVDIELQATSEDAQHGSVVHSFDPITVNPDAPQEAINTLRDWVLMAVQDHVHPFIAWGAGDRFPAYDAYLAYRRYFEEFEAKGTAAAVHFFRAVDLDPDFVRPRIQVGSMWMPDLLPDIHDRIILFFEPAREARLTVRQQQQVAMIDARLEGRWEDAYRLAYGDLKRDPEDSYQRSVFIASALWANRPLAAVEAAQKLEWDSIDPLFPSAGRYMEAHRVALALHLLGRHEEELALARQQLAAGPIKTIGSSTRSDELRALAALGRVDQIDVVITVVDLEQDVLTPDWREMTAAARELRAHGFAEAAQALADRAVAETEDLASESSSCGWCRAFALKEARRFEEARASLGRLVAADSEDRDLIAALGVCTARLGDRATALELAARLEELGDATGETGVPYQWRGQTLYRRACIAANLGDRDRALDLLRRSVLEGYNNWAGMHCDPDLETLWHDPGFQEILKPRG